MIGDYVKNVGAYASGAKKRRNTGGPGESWGTPAQWAAAAAKYGRGGTAGAAGAPGGGGAPGDAAGGPDQLPWDAAYAQAQASIQNNLSAQGAAATGDENALAINYGVNVDRNPDGSLKAASIAPNVDVTNPFSRAALLKKSYEAQQRGNTTSMGARGQLYSGALQNAQNYAGSRFVQGQDALLKDFGSGWSGIMQRRLAAQSSANDQLYGAGQDRLATALANRADAPGSPAPIQSGEKGADYLARLPYTIAIIGGKRVKLDKITGRPWGG